MIRCPVRIRVYTCVHTHTHTHIPVMKGVNIKYNLLVKPIGSEVAEYVVPSSIYPLRTFEEVCLSWAYLDAPS